MDDVRIHAYPSIFALGHKSVASLTDAPVIVEEKVDGSQFSFGVLEDGQPHARSKGQQLVIDAPEKMFELACATVLEVAPLLHRGWVYRGEYLQKPKHNTLVYDRVPQKHVVLFDICPGREEYLSPEAKAKEAARIGLEVVPALFVGKLAGIDMLNALLERQSFLGGQKIEGVVVKPLNYDQFGNDKKVLMAKYVSEAFKEVHEGEWKKSNPTRSDIIDAMVATYRTPARWQKAVQHMAEAGSLESSPRDIGNLMKEVVADTEKECADEIKEALYRYAWPKIRRGITVGLPEWYKQELAKAQFGKES